mmetsp:Transcript_33978/g.47072  ORF Transcript_33978/g.47072 Transcript_33978/m.47072 type:complete len:113 (+) Transcript_33978:1-339(+)
MHQKSNGMLGMPPAGILSGHRGSLQADDHSLWGLEGAARYTIYRGDEDLERISGLHKKVANEMDAERKIANESLASKRSRLEQELKDLNVKRMEKEQKRRDEVAWRGKFYQI